ncbi:MAG: ketopantoate reductase family protein [Albidovulum sp.]
MKIAVAGAGAIGCYFGGLLARAGHDVLFIGRKSHVDVINAKGLLFETKAFTQYVAAKAATGASAVDKPGLVLVCVKSTDTEDAGRMLQGRLGPETIILSLQNGVDNAERLSASLAQEVLSAVVYVGTEMAGLGHVRHHGRGELLIGASDQSADLARTLREAGIPTVVSADITAALWTKLIINCAYNALSAVAGIAYGPMLATQGTAEVMTSAVRECLAVADACGVALPDDQLAETMALAGAMPHQKSSTAQDLARGKATEIDFLNGYIVRKGAELGISTPTNQALQVMVKLAEKSRALALAKHGD